MNSGFALFLAFGIGVVSGLRSMTAPAIVAWAAHLGWISLSGSHLAFMGSAWAVGVFTLGALAEFVADQLPTTPALAGALIGAIGAIAGGFGGCQARVGLVQGLHVPDIAIAIPEDLIAIGLGLFLVSRF